MDPLAMDIVREAIILALVVSLPALAVALLVGLVVSILQTLTQITDPTLTFVPKIIAVFLTLVIVGPWMMTMLVDFARRVWE